jgi:hypothetical protein
LDSNVVSFCADLLDQLHSMRLLYFQILYTLE